MRPSSPFISQTGSQERGLRALVRQARWALALFVALLALLTAALVVQSEANGVVGDVAGVAAIVLMLVVLWCFWILFLPWSG